MSITSQLFYRKYGVRLLQQIMTPVFFDLNTLDFPLKSIYHYTTFDGIELGPPSDDYLFRNIKKPIMVGHVSDVGAQLGNPRKQAVNTAAFIRDYQNQNRRMRPLRNVVLASKDPTSLIVYNYCFINKIHRYVRSVFTEYYKWYNTFAAVVNNIATVSNESDHGHYLLCAAPKVIPSLQQLNLASTAGMTQALLKVFKDKDAFMLLELWKYLGANRKSSLFDKIPSNKIHLVNFIYQESGKWTVLNLGVLNSFRQGFEGEDKEYVLDSKLKVDALQLQKRLLKMTMTIMEIRTVTANLVEEPVKDEKVIAPLTGLEIKDEDTDAETAEETDEDEDEDEEDVPTVPSELEPVPVETAANEVTNQITDIDDESEIDEEELEKQRIKEEDELLDKDLAYLNEIAKKQENEATESTGTIADIIAEADITLEDGVMNICDRLADDGLLTAGEYRRFKNLSNAYKEIISPDGHTPLSEFIVIKPEDLKMTESATMVDSPSILDKSMLKSSLIDFDSRYIENVLSKDTANMVLNVQKAGIAVTNYKVEKVRDILGGYETHMLKIAPVEGAPSTLKFKLPIVDADGRFESNGIKYFLRKQRGDCPIRKVDYNRVALTSYYGKVFINRAKRKAVDYGHWLQCITMEKGLDKLDHDITDIKPANVFDNSLKSPRSYSSLSMSFKSLMCRGYTVTFDRSEVLKTYPVHVLNTFEKDGNLVIGVNASSSYLIMDKEGAVYTTEGDELKLFGTFENFLNILVGTSPVESVDISVFGKDVPIGIVLAYQIGFEKLMNLLKVTPRRVNAGSRLNLEANEYAIAFSDETLIFSRDDRLASLILAGFNEYHRALKLFSVYSFDKRGVYLNLLDTNKLGVRYLREIDLMYTMFIDPITKDLLIEMKEPTTFQGLLFRSCEMLLDDQHPDELDPAYMRIKGYERLSGAVYTELVQAIRVHGGKLGKSNKPIELNPYAVWKRIAEDPSKGQVSEINPIKALRESEAVTYAGSGGRNKRSMTGHTRSYHVNDMGTISESTVDSSDVAINVFTSADPQFTSLRGMSKRYDFKTTGATALLSTSALLAAGSDRDDPKRVNFVAIQQEHSISCDGYTQPMVRTGYEQIVPQRSSDLFALTAKKPGIVKSLNDKGIIIEYEDDTIQGYEIGRRFGNSAGLVIPHKVVTRLKAGDTVALGDAIVYNDGFFEPDFFDPKKIVLKNATTVKTVLWESSQTLEDACSVSTRAANKLMTQITKVKTIVLRFDQYISKLVSVGDSLDSDSILCIIEDEITAGNKLFDEQTIETLKAVGSQTPRAHVKGIVEKVEVFYNGDKEDMTESILAIVNTGDKNLKKYADSLGHKAFTGSVDSGFRIENNPLGLDTVAIRVYITTSVSAGSGDKTVFGNQLKSVISSIMDKPYTTENGEMIDAIFGCQSVNDRIITSGYVIGTTNTLLKVIAKQAVALYKK